MPHPRYKLCVDSGRSGASGWTTLRPSARLINVQEARDATGKPPWKGDALNMQRVHSAQVHAQTLKSFHNSLPVPQSVDVSLGSGPKSGAYLVAEEGTRQ